MKLQVTVRTEDRRGGVYAPVSPEELKVLRAKHGLTQAQVGLLARTSVFKGEKKSFQSRRVQAWEAGENRMPLASWELLVAKLYLMERGVTFEDLVNRPIIDFIKKADSGKPLLASETGAIRALEALSRGK